MFWRLCIVPVLLASMAACAVLPPAASPLSPTERNREIAALLANAENEGASGILRISHGGELLFEGGFGSASCSEHEEISPDHLFMIGSITKDLTQLLAFVLEERGFLDLSLPVGYYLDTLSGPLADTSMMALLDHVGGLPDLIDETGRPVPYSVEYDYIPVTRQQLIARASLAQLQFSPGEEEYSNLGYQLLAASYEAATGMSFAELLRIYIYTPAQMTATDFWFPNNSEREFTDGCRANNVHWGNPIDDDMWQAQGPSWNLMGAGGLLSSAQSLEAFFLGVADGVFFTNAENAERYRRYRMPMSASRQQLVMGPAGSNGIFNAAAFWANSDRFSLILITNRADHPAEGGLFRDLIRLFPAQSFR
ncbi:MAG: hypothetical protein DHS20C12_29210 [Pseudohongiella sp.]|nr:MAG: hypothetical protein DHS20C12_29210 [Pseudohongiella sp.]